MYIYIYIYRERYYIGIVSGSYRDEKVILQGSYRDSTPKTPTLNPNGRTRLWGSALNRHTSGQDSGTPMRTWFSWKGLVGILFQSWVTPTLPGTVVEVTISDGSRDPKQQKSYHFGELAGTDCGNRVLVIALKGLQGSKEDGNYSMLEGLGSRGPGNSNSEDHMEQSDNAMDNWA